MGLGVQDIDQRNLVESSRIYRLCSSSTTDAMSAKTGHGLDKKNSLPKNLLVQSSSGTEGRSWGTKSRVKSGDFLAGKVKDHTEAEA
jgi:hypothetical protein